MNNETLRLEERAKFLNAQSCISHDATHRESVDWIVSRNGENANAVSHPSANFDFTDVCATDEVVTHHQILLYRFANIGDGFSFRRSLRPASGNAGASGWRRPVLAPLYE